VEKLGAKPATTMACILDGKALGRLGRYPFDLLGCGVFLSPTAQNWQRPMSILKKVLTTFNLTPKMHGF